VSLWEINFKVSAPSAVEEWLVSPCHIHCCHSGAFCLVDRGSQWSLMSISEGHQMRWCNWCKTSKM